MEKSNEVNVAQWVDQRLAILTPGNVWQPNGNHGLKRFRERSGAKFSWKQAWTWPATLVAAGLILFFLAAPPPRVLAQRCVDCSLALWQSLAAAPRVQPDLQPETARKLAPDFSLNDVSGKPIKLSDFKGKVVLLNFWATWCGGCQTEIPWFIEFQNKYKQPGLSVIGASMDDDGWKSVTPYVKEKNVNYCIVIATQAVAKQYAVEAMPATWLIDREGKIAAIHVGLVTKSAYEAEVETLLGLKH
jgi:peroxiredoxin